MPQLNMLASNPGQQFQCQSGNNYTADVNGFLLNVTVKDVVDLMRGGCQVLPYMDMASILTQFGGSAIAQPNAMFAEEGNLYRLVGNPVAGNAADTTDDIVAGIVLPANCFDIASRGLAITVQGKFGATANNKRFKVWANPTMANQTVTAGVISGGQVSGVGSGVLLFDSGVQTGNAVGWGCFLNLFKYGAAGANTQYSQGSGIYGTTHGGITVPVFSTLAENAAINLVVTGSSPTTGAASDVVLNFLEVNAMN